MGKVYTTRTRDIEFVKRLVGTTYTPGLAPAPYFDGVPQTVVGKQATTSRGNPGYQVLHHKGRYSAKRFRKPLNPRVERALRSQDQGGNFTTTKNFYSEQPAWVDLPMGSSITVRGYTGGLWPTDPGIPKSDPIWPSVTPESNANLIIKGTEAIARTIPTNPLADLNVALGELVSDVPKIPGHALMRKGLSAHTTAEEYLNYEFGIAPTISDIQKTAGVVKDFNKILAQYSRDSGRNIRRRYQFPVQSSTTVTNYADRYPIPALTIYHGVTKGSYQRVRTTTVRYSFSGCYTYYLDPGETIWGRLIRSEQVANRLFGTRFTPRTAWKLTPWSWLVDWQSNAGDVITNISALSRDGLVIRYAYIMAETTITDTYTLTGVRIRSGPVGTLSQTFGTTIKQRLKATPYGFGLNTDSFTTEQWAILGALGISKAPGKL